MLNEGVFLGQRYEIVRRIGTGGMADVYKGKDHKLKRYVAIKVLKREFGEDDSFVKKFRIEAQAAAGMMHPNVVNVYDVGEDQGLNYMVMELVEGITLKDYIQKKGSLTDKETISIAIQMASGLEAAHNKHLVHRDVKPQNVMISKDGKVKVTDFGIAKATTSNTISSNVMGSVHYTSPEQARGGSCDIQSDIYSTGITMYEMVTGEVPFDGDSTVAIAVKHLQEEILPPSEYVPDMYFSLEQIILKCTQKSPGRRYENMSALILDLKHSLVDPDGDFVAIGPMAYSDTVPLTDDELEEMEREYNDYDDEYEGADEDEEEYNPENQEEIDPKMKKITKILTIVVIVIILGIVIFFIGRAAGLFKVGPKVGTGVEKTDTVKVPDVTGMTEEEAKKVLTDKGLGFNVKSREESTQYEEGQIIAQDPKADSEVDKNTTINVTVCSGKATEEVEVPDVVGKSENDAQKALNDAGFKVESTTDYSDEHAQGTVMKTNPTGGSKAAKDSTVTITVSMGSDKIAVPDLVGKSSSKAQSALNKAGLKGSATEDYSDSVATGNVISQDTSAGTKVAKGTTVNYVVSKGKKPDERITVPSGIVGMEEELAVEKLEGMGFTTDVKDQNNDTVTAGYVISMSVAPGTKVDKGTKITLTISIGPASQGGN